jgi:phenylpyruvate tautomerase PptA (4-oxalocrotonate tautomerase family)
MVFRNDRHADVAQMPITASAAASGTPRSVAGPGADRDKQPAVVERLTAVVAAAAGDPSLAERTWVLLTEAVPGGWGLHGHANTNDELVHAALAQISQLQARS